MGKLRLLSLVLILAILCGVGWREAFAGIDKQLEGQEYFSETGHWVVGEFLAKYRETLDPLLVYGYPITEAYEELATRRLVQYFQKARFELYPAEPAGERVKLSPLGEYLYKSGQSYQLPANSPGCRTFAAANHQVCYSFLEFYDAHGGLAQFGEPISDMEWRNERIVQYFENARMEWQPSLARGQSIVLADLGSEYFFTSGENPVRRRPDPGNGTVQGILNLKARSYPRQAVTGKDGIQTVYVIVQDQRLFPVVGAQVTLVVELPSGEQTRFIVPVLTNEQGVTSYTFPFSSMSIGIVRIWVRVSHDNLEAETLTSFRIWW